MTVDHWASLVFVIAFVRGAFSTWWLRGRYRAIQHMVVRRDRLILLTFVGFAMAATTIAGYFGFLTIRRVFGFEPLNLVPLNLLVLAGVMLTPDILRLVVRRVQQ